MILLEREKCRRNSLLEDYILVVQLTAVGLSSKHFGGALSVLKQAGYGKINCLYELLVLIQQFN